MPVDDRSDEELKQAREQMRPVVAELLHTMRGGGIPNPMAALEQLSFLLLLLYFEPSAWSELLAASREQRFAMLHDTLFADAVRQPRWGGEALRAVMRQATLAFLSPELLDLVMRKLDRLPRGRFLCADLLDAALDEVSATSSVGSPRTPTSVSECMIALTKPWRGDLTLDPAAGAGDRMLSVIRRSAIEGRRESASELIRGVDSDATIVRLGVMSLTFHGIDSPNLTIRNVLAEPPDLSERFDVILCQPPFGIRIDPSMLAPEFRAIRGARSEVLFAELTLSRLAPQGRAAIVLPANVAFSSGAAPRRLRSRLLDGLRGVITLPQGMFQPHTNVETLIVAVGPPSSHVVFVDARDDERGRTAESQELLRRSGAIVDDLLTHGVRPEDLSVADGGRVFVVDKSTIRDNDCSLLPTTYRPRGPAARPLDSPLALFDEIERVEADITQRLVELGARLTLWSGEND
jgi:N-6 DNA methylase